MLGCVTDVLAPELRDRAPARRPLDEPELEQIRLVDVLDRVGLLAERDRKGGEPDRAAVEFLHHRAQESAVDPLEPALVELGWSLVDAERALADVDESLPVEEQVRAALRKAA